MSDTERRTQAEGEPAQEGADAAVGTIAETDTPRTDSEAARVGEAETVAQGASLWADAWYDLRRNPVFVGSALLIAVFAVMAAFPSLFTSADPRSCSLSNSLGRPSAAHWFGFDLQGCDYYARTVYGARISVSIGLFVVAFVVTIAVVGGSIAGYYGKAVDTVIARVTDMWFAIPTLLGGIVILVVLGARTFFSVSFILIVLSWPTMLRLMRSAVLSAKEEDFVDAARALGANDLRILTRHILPNAIAPVIVYATISVGVVISAEAALAFLGVGLQPPTISWGSMISASQNRVLSAPHLLAFPGLFLSLTIFGFILMGDALRDALDPKQQTL